jgi:hypothetical protein
MRYTPLILALCASACLASSGNELTGQVKKVVKKTPIVCPNYAEVDISLGVLRNGVGSMSKEDVVLAVTDPADVEGLEKAADEGAIVKVTYDVRRISYCTPNHQMLSFVVLQAGSGS